MRRKGHTSLLENSEEYKRPVVLVAELEGTSFPLCKGHRADPHRVNLCLCSFKNVCVYSLLK